MSIDSRSVGFAATLDWIACRRGWWFSFVESVMLTGLLQYLAWRFHSWALLGFWVVSVVFLITPIALAVVESIGAAYHRLPWARIEALPRLITYPAVIAVSCVVVVLLLVLVNYTGFELASVIEAIAKSHVEIH